MVEQMTDTPMMEETARVIEVREGILIAEAKSRSGCSQCGSGSCTTSVVAKLFGVKRNRLVLKNSLGARVGDQVVVGIPNELLVRASVTAYLIPLVFMFALAALGELAGLSEGWVSLLALSGLAIGFFTLRRFFHGSRSRRYEPRLLRVVAPYGQWVELPALKRS
jgi:sigma-E factor negative regulatory protein RseC